MGNAKPGPKEKMKGAHPKWKRNFVRKIEVENEVRNRSHKPLSKKSLRPPTISHFIMAYDSLMMSRRRTRNQSQIEEGEHTLRRLSLNPNPNVGSKNSKLTYQRRDFGLIVGQMLKRQIR